MQTKALSILLHMPSITLGRTTLVIGTRSPHGGELKGVVAKHGGHATLSLYPVTGEQVADRGLVHPVAQAQHYSGHDHTHHGSHIARAEEHQGVAVKDGGHASLNLYQATGEKSCSPRPRSPCCTCPAPCWT